MILNRAVISLIKTYQDVDFKKAAFNFQVGDIVSYADSSGIKIHGVITKKNPKTLQVTTEQNHYVNTPATFLTLKNKPSQKSLTFKQEIELTKKEILKTLNSHLKNNNFH